MKEKNATQYGIFDSHRDDSVGFISHLSSSFLQLLMSLNHTLFTSEGGSAVWWPQWRNVVQWYKMPFSLDVS